MAADFTKIKTIAKEKGITLNELAERVDMTPTGLGILIKSPRAMTDNVERIANELGVRIGVFFGENEPVAVGNPTADLSELKSIIAQKETIIAQKDEIIAQKDKLIECLLNRQ